MTEFYRTIVDNNLFRPLGWRPPRPRESYRLIGTGLLTDANTPKQAVVQATAENKTSTVRSDRKLQDVGLEKLLEQDTAQKTTDLILPKAL